MRSVRKDQTAVVSRLTSKKFITQKNPNNFLVVKFSEMYSTVQRFYLNGNTTGFHLQTYN